jgi:hypothetical protein
MSQVPKILPLAAALAALTGTAGIVSNPADAKVAEPSAPAALAGHDRPKAGPNRVVSVGEDFLGFIVSTADDGTVLAQHYSHYSHASHASHASHYSSRY